MKENMESWSVISLMSGTSLDGLDIVYTKIFKQNNEYNFQLLNCETISYPKFWEENLRNAFNCNSTEIQKLDVDYGEYLGEIVVDFIIRNNISNVDFISSHGHTVFHKPDEGFTLQIGDGQSISNKIGLKVVCDFRTQDVNLGGQGAPLVPIGDKLFFSEYKFCLNLGGFANISFEKDKKRIAFDICPVNIVLNYYSKKLGYDYDNNGNIAKSGNISLELLNQLNNISFYRKSPPKSLGFEFVKAEIFPIIEKFNINEKDILRTFVEHIIFQISKYLDNNKISKLLITGGGANNIFLINELKKTNKTEIIIPNKEIVDYKEALIFALLGVLRLNNEINCLKSVTGASRNSCSGKIFNKHS